MTEYERTLSVEAPADSVFQYVSDTANVPAYLPDAQGANFSLDPESRAIDWTGEGTSGQIRVDSGDVTPQLSEITMRLVFNDREPSDSPSNEDEKTLDRIDEALRTIQKHVEQAHRTRGANFM